MLESLGKHCLFVQTPVEVRQPPCAGRRENKGKKKKDRRLTILVSIRHPPFRFNHTRLGPQFLHAILGVLQALLNVDPFMGLDGLTQNGHIEDRGVEGLMTSTLLVIDVLADDLPIVEAESLRAKNLIRVFQAV
jgi:hypothetical protein